MPETRLLTHSWSAVQRAYGVETTRQGRRWLAETASAASQAAFGHIDGWCGQARMWATHNVASQPFCALGTAVGVHATMLAAHCARPQLPLPSLAVQVGITLSALAFGWCVGAHRLIALGCVLGAAVGLALTACLGLSHPVLLVCVAGLSFWFGGSLGYLATHANASEAAPQHALDPADLPHGVARVVAPDVEHAAYARRLQVALQPEAEPARGGVLATGDEEPADLAVRRRLRAALAALEGPYAALYRSKGLHHVQIADGVQSAENKLGTAAWLRRFESLLPTLGAVAPLSAEHSQQFDAVLEERLADFWGNTEVKTKIRRCVAMQQRGADTMSVARLMGASGTGKNMLVNAVKHAFGISRDITLTNVSLDELTGFTKTYVDAEPSLVTSLLMQAQNSHCVSHIDEVDLASHANQQALLSLLAPENQFVDGYFGLPINKQRLFVLCTMKGNAVGMQNLVPDDLWNRLKKHAVRTSELTPTGRLAIAERALNKTIAAARMPAIAPAAAASVAAEICLHCPEQEPGRFIADTVNETIERAALLEKMSQRLPDFSPALVLRAINHTWASLYHFQKATPRVLLPTKYAHIEVLALFARIGPQARDLRWHAHLSDDRRIVVNLRKTDVLRARLYQGETSLDCRALHIDMSYLPSIAVQPNEHLSQDFLTASTWPTPPAFTTANYFANDEASLSGLCHWARQMDGAQMLVAIPLVISESRGQE